jgi:hypothetical protein
MSETQKTTKPRKTNTSISSFDKKKEREFEEMKRQLAELLAQKESTIKPKSNSSIDLDEDIDVMSLCNNKLNLTTGGFGKGENYWFKKFGEIKPVPFKDLKEIVKNNRSFLEKGYFYVEDKRAREVLRISKLYENLPAAQDLITLLDKDIKTINVTLKRATPEQKTMIASIVVDKLCNNEEIDMNVVKEIGDSVGRDLVTIANDKKEILSGQGDE